MLRKDLAYNFKFKQLEIMSTIKTVSLPIKDVQLTQEGNLVIISTPTKSNPKGVYAFNANQTARICQRAGVPHPLGLKHIVALDNGTAKLTFQEEECVAGQAWTNGKEGAELKTGTYEKDWIKSSNHEVALGFASKQTIGNVVIQSMFSNIGTFAAPSRVAPAPVMVAEVVDNAPDVKDESTGSATSEANPAV